MEDENTPEVCAKGEDCCKIKDTSAEEEVAEQADSCCGGGCCA